MAISIQKEACSGCRACFCVCPRECIVMTPDPEGFGYPTIDKTRCVDCGLCEQVCPAVQASSKPSACLPRAYAAQSTNEAIRSASSSGGVFSLLAEEIIKQNGVVFGAAFSNDFREVHHIAVERIEDLDKLRGSKYLQSSVDNTYLEAKKFLLAGKKVLFSGTPCQIEGLRAYLRKPYENLLCVDIICHGVPSPKVWDRYVSYRENQSGAPTEKVYFRYKKGSWKKYSIYFEHGNGVIYEKVFNEDPFMQSFLRNACLRPSCAQCRFKKINRVSDITLADFWGINRISPETDDDKGTSLVLIHTDAGKRAFDNIQKHLSILEVNATEALKYNSAATTSAIAHNNRSKFFAHLDKLPFDSLVKRYAKQKTSIKSKIIRCLQKLHLWNVVQVLRGKIEK